MNTKPSNDLFILGAGFSKAVSSHMPVLTELSDEIESRLAEKDETKSISTGLCRAFPRNIELWMTYLSQIHPWLSEAQNLRNRAAFFDILWHLRNVLSIKEGLAISSPCADWFCRLVEKWHAEHTPVVTLNYDTLVERCATQVKLENGHLDCGSIYPVILMRLLQLRGGYMNRQNAKTFTLHKLHGSVNWFYSGAANPTGEPIYYGSRSPYRGGGWEFTGTEKVPDDKVPFIVPPLTEKHSYFQHETVRSLWSHAATALNSATRVFVLGYSLPTTDLGIRFFLSQNCVSTAQTFYLVNTDNRIVEHFRNLVGSEHTINSEFVVTESTIPNFVDSYVSGKL